MLSSKLPSSPKNNDCPPSNSSIRSDFASVIASASLLLPRPSPPLGDYLIPRSVAAVQEAAAERSSTSYSGAPETTRKSWRAGLSKLKRCETTLTTRQRMGMPS